MHTSSGFQRLALSNLAAQSAEQIGLAATPLVAVLLLQAGPGETGLLQTVQTLPFLLLSLPAGLLADRLSRTRLMVAAETVRAAALLCALLLIVLQQIDIVTLAVLGFIGATGTVVYSVTTPSLVPALVTRAELPTANSRLELARSSAFAAGPALAGALVGWAGGSAAFVIATMLSALAALLLARLPEPARAALPRRHVWHDLREGAGFVFVHPYLRPILCTAVLFNTGWFVLQAVYVPYAVQALGMDATAIGITLGLYGAGMVGGALLAPRLAGVLSFGTMLILGPVAGLAAALIMAATILAPSAILAGASFFLFGVGPILWTITTTTLRQTVTPPAMLGRVSALIMTSTFGARPLGAAIGAGVGGWVGAPACLLVAAVLFLGQFLLIAASPVPRLSQLPDAAPQIP